MNDIKAIIFDYGRTLHDSDNGEFFVGALKVCESLSKKYKLAIVSITRPQTMDERWGQIRNSGLEKLFAYIELIPEAEKKDEAFERAVKKLGVAYPEIAIVDDRTVRGIRWGNKHGCTTIWLRRGKFANELPNQQTGEPTWTISDLRELKNIL